jgi:glutaminyl-tRNA synthetase
MNFSVSGEAINDFCDTVGVTRRGNENITHMNVLEHCIRKDLDEKAKRVFAVLDPVKLILTDVDEKYAEIVKALHFPKKKDSTTYDLTFGREMWVDRSDTRTEDNKDFYGFAPNKLVGLKYAHTVRVKSVKANEKGEVIEVLAELDKSGEKPKTFVNWVPAKEAHGILCNVYEHLFTHEHPNSLGDKWLETINPNSLAVKTGAKVHNSILGKFLKGIC